MPFDIRDYTDRLEHRLVRENAYEARYLCPICNKDTFTINKSKGAYQCWGGCLCGEIREWLGVPKRDGDKAISMRAWQHREDKPNPPMVYPEQLKLIKVNPPKPKLPLWRGRVKVEVYQYSQDQHIERVEWIDCNGVRQKEFRQ
jgi:putative DNA primase/helicase